MVKLILGIIFVVMVILSGYFMGHAVYSVVPGNNLEYQAYKNSTGCGFPEATDPTIPCSNIAATVVAKRIDDPRGNLFRASRRIISYVSLRDETGKTRELPVGDYDYGTLAVGDSITETVWKDYVVDLHHNGEHIATHDLPGFQAVNGPGLNVALTVFAAGLTGLGWAMRYRRRRRLWYLT